MISVPEKRLTNNCARKRNVRHKGVVRQTPHPTLSKYAYVPKDHST